MPPSWRPVPACAHDFAAGGPFFAATTTTAGGTILLCDEENWSRTRFVVAARCSGGAGATPAAFYLGLCRLRGILSPPAPHDHAAGGTVLLCRHDGAALILDFKPRLANRCSLGADLWQIRASILDFKPRLANRCSRWAILGRNRAVILDFRPILANRCSLGADLWQNRASILDFRPRLANRDRKSTRLNSSHKVQSRMPSSA